jgi:hypothetical protein
VVSTARVAHERFVLDQTPKAEFAVRHHLQGIVCNTGCLVYEDDGAKTCVEYDRPSSLFGQFGTAKVTEVAAMLDQKLEQLVAEAIR